MRFAALNPYSLLQCSSNRKTQEKTNGSVPILTNITSQKVKGLSKEAVIVSKIRTPAMIVALACNRSLAVIAGMISIISTSKGLGKK